VFLGRALFGFGYLVALPLGLGTLAK
jgi:hypothetical protein